MSVEVRAGDVVYVTRAASVQFVSRPIMARVIRVRDDLTTYDGWCWLDVYQLDVKGDAVDRRTILVRPEGLTTTTEGRVRQDPALAMCWRQRVSARPRP
ncbi:hypothetical protein [Micromonospora sp. WMMD998]|uniref:hypothetical protein n=1 Tax=Micromonospora sp. WMMD998 TaxID=3016092 RepID=UPI00249BBA6E|nr:hypothetical protein [Micromonospora sp. WMMD998]WFE37576.1 hypothetical protein O7619_03645 [Micromonospora sp. WMMD998]